MVIALAVAGSAVPTSASAVARRDEATTRRGPRITLTAQSPWVSTGDPFLLGVRVIDAPDQTQVRVSVHRPLANRAALGRTIATNKAGRELFNLTLLPIGDLPSEGDGKAVRVLIRTRRSGTVQTDPHEVATAKTRDRGIYPVQVRLLRADGTILARLTTYLVRTPQDPSQATPLRAALLIELGAPLALDTNGEAVVDRSGLGPLKTLVAALRAHPDVPTTLVPSPQSLDALRSSPDRADRVLLNQVLALGGAGNQVLAPTYVPLDVSAWTQAGLLDPLTRQRLIGTNVLDALRLSSDNRTWTAGADLTSAALGRLLDRGVQQLVVPETGLAPLDPARFPDSPTEPFKVPTDQGIPTPAWQIDDRLQQAFTRTTDPVLGANELLAELTLTSFEQNGTAGGVVLAPPDGWHPSAGFLRVLLDGLRPANPVVAATTVDQLFALVPPAGSNGAAATRKGDRGVDLVRPLAPKAPPPLGTFPDQLRSVSQKLASYGSMVGPTSGRLTRFQHRLDLAGSSDLSPGRRDALLALVAQRLDRQFKRVSTPRREKVTLTARDADFPLTLQNTLGYPVDVVIDLQASNRLTFPDGNRIQKRLVGQRTRVKLRVRAPVSGDTPLQVTVRSPDGNIVLAESTYTVRSTAVSGVGIVLTGGAALFLLIWWVRHWRSSARNRRNRPSPA